jgi:hypothetical protein
MPKSGWGIAFLEEMITTTHYKRVNHEMPLLSNPRLRQENTVYRSALLMLSG